MHKSSLGNLIREKRKFKNMTQVDVSDKLDISHRHYQDIEAGKINIRLDTLLKLLNYFEIDLLITKDQLEEYTL